MGRTPQCPRLARARRTQRTPLRLRRKGRQSPRRQLMARHRICLRWKVLVRPLPPIWRWVPSNQSPRRLLRQRARLRLRHRRAPRSSAVILSRADDEGSHARRWTFGWPVTSPAVRRSISAQSGHARSHLCVRSFAVFAAQDDARKVRGRVAGKRTSYAPAGMPSGFGPAFSFNACVNSCRLETICGAFVSTVLASFSE